jgi:hypothetical protein
MPFCLPVAQAKHLHVGLDMDEDAFGFWDTAVTVEQVAGDGLGVSAAKAATRNERFDRESPQPCTVSTHRIMGVRANYSVANRRIHL